MSDKEVILATNTQESLHLDRKEAIAALLFDSEVWDEEDPRPSEEACHSLAEEILEFFFGE